MATGRRGGCRSLPVPGAVGKNDAFAGPEFGERAAQRLRARLVLFEDSGHWWPLTKPAETAAALEALWNQAGNAADGPKGASKP